MNMTMQSTSVIATGVIDQNNTIPLKFTTKTGDMNMTMNGQKMPAMDAATHIQTIMYGKFTGDGKIHVDSVAGKKLDDAARNNMVTVINDVQNGLKFPDHPMKIGDTFTQESPFDMPLPGMAGSQGSKATVKIIYKLISITNNIATFNLDEALSVNVDQAAQNQTVQVKVSGTGNGTLTYDINKQFFTTMNNNINLDFDIGLPGGMNMKGKGTVSTTSKTDIAAN
jgi:hypothetical protein